MNKRNWMSVARCVQAKVALDEHATAPPPCPSPPPCGTPPPHSSSESTSSIITPEPEPAVHSLALHMPQKPPPLSPPKDGRSWRNSWTCVANPFDRQRWWLSVEEAAADAREQAQDLSPHSTTSWLANVESRAVPDSSSKSSAEDTNRLRHAVSRAVDTLLAVQPWTGCWAVNWAPAVPANSAFVVPKVYSAPNTLRSQSE